MGLTYHGHEANLWYKVGHVNNKTKLFPIPVSLSFSKISYVHSSPRLSRVINPYRQHGRLREVQ